MGGFGTVEAKVNKCDEIESVLYKNHSYHAAREGRVCARGDLCHFSHSPAELFMGRQIKALAFPEQAQAAASGSGSGSAGPQAAHWRPGTPPRMAEAGSRVRSRSPLYRHPAGSGTTKQVKAIASRVRSRSPVVRPQGAWTEKNREQQTQKHLEERTQTQWIREACGEYTARHQELDSERGRAYEFWGQAYRACVDYSLDDFHYGDDLSEVFLVCKACDQKINQSNTTEPCTDRYGDPQFARYQHVTTASQQKRATRQRSCARCGALAGQKGRGRSYMGIGTVLGGLRDTTICGESLISRLAVGACDVWFDDYLCVLTLSGDGAAGTR